MRGLLDTSVFIADEPGRKLASDRLPDEAAISVVTLAELEPPFRIVERGRGGKFNRVKMLGTYELVEDAHDSQSCQVTYTYESDPQVPSDRLAEFFGGRSGTRRQAAKAMRRLRSILEDGTRRGAKPTVAGG